MSTLSTAEQLKLLQEQMNALKATIPQVQVNGKTVKIHETGTISFYGYGKFPINVRLSSLNEIIEITKTEGFKALVAQNIGLLTKTKG